MKKPTELELETIYRKACGLHQQSNYLFQKPLTQWDKYDLSNWEQLVLKIESNVEK